MEYEASRVNVARAADGQLSRASAASQRSLCSCLPSLRSIAHGDCRYDVMIVVSIRAARVGQDGSMVDEFALGSRRGRSWSRHARRSSVYERGTSRELARTAAAAG
jgi:hypothetical protein